MLCRPAERYAALTLRFWTSIIDQAQGPVMRKAAQTVPANEAISPLQNSFSSVGTPSQVCRSTDNCRISAATRLKMGIMTRSMWTVKPVIVWIVARR